MRKRAIYLFFLLTLSVSLHGLDLDIGAEYVPYAFVFDPWNFGDTDTHNSNFDTGQYIVYRAGLKHRSGFNVGLGLGYNSGYDIDNNFIGQFSDLLAFLGYKQFNIRVTNSRIPGSITLIGDLADEQPRTRRFTATRTTVELLYNFESDDYPMTLLGLYYLNSTGASSMQVNRGSYDGSELYAHSEIIGNVYGIVWGMDMLSEFIYKIDHNNGGFSVGGWFDMWMYFGLGGGIEKTIDNKYENDNVFTLDFRVNSTLGLLFGGGKKTKIFVGLGYNVDVSAGIIHGFIGRIGLRF
jgi:hypothetical protein